MYVEGGYTPKYFVVPLAKDKEKTYVENRAATVTLTDEAGRKVFTKTFRYPSDFQEFIIKYIISYPGYTTGLALLIPPRTQSWGEFAQALLFPTVVNHAFSQHGIAQRVAGAVAGLAIDLFTLIPRALVAPLRMHQNPPNIPHPLFELLKDDPEASHALEKGILRAEMRVKVISINEGRRCGYANGIDFNASVESIKVTKLILTNPNIPCPIQEDFETHTRTKIFQGRLLIPDRRAFLTRNHTNSDANRITNFHFLTGLSEQAFSYSTYFTNDWH